MATQNLQGISQTGDVHAALGQATSKTLQNLSSNVPKTQIFQGTSPAGDFHAALYEAASKALEALSDNVSDRRIAWKLIEISGSNGGLLDEETITVTIEARID